MVGGFSTDILAVVAVTRGVRCGSEDAWELSSEHFLPPRSALAERGGSYVNQVVLICRESGSRFGIDRRDGGTLRLSL